MAVMLGRAIWRDRKLGLWDYLGGKTPVKRAMRRKEEQRWRKDLGKEDQVVLRGHRLVDQGQGDR